MATHGKSKSIRQSVTLTVPLAKEVRRIARQQRIPMSRALVSLAEQGVQARRDRRQQILSAYGRLVSEQNPQAIEQAGEDLMESIFGKNAFAKDPVH